MTHNFAEKLAEGQEWEAWAAEWVPEGFPTFQYKRVAVGGKEDRSGIDGYQYRGVQVKADMRAHETRNIFIETVSVVETGAPGWAVKCAADIILYLIPGLGYVLPLDPAAIREHLDDWSAEYREQDIPNDRHTTRGLLVPMKEVLQKVSAEPLFSASLLRLYNKKHRVSSAA